MKLPIAFIDTFTSTAFKGNPTAVCITNSDLESHLMLSIASEMNCPVTAFLTRSANVDEYRIRYFTPVTEISACGHATLGAARMLMDRHPERAVVHFLTVEKTRIKAVMEKGNILMTYPVYQMTEFTLANEMLLSLGINNTSTAGYSVELETVFIEIEDPRLLKKIRPNYEQLLASDNTIKEVVLTSASDSKDFDYLLRSFCPWIGINEDPVTGSVHAVLGNFWKQKLNKSSLKAYQASARGGELTVNAFDHYTEIGGQSVIILRGEITV